MEKDQNINPESQNEEIKENEVGEQIQVEQEISAEKTGEIKDCLLYTSPSPRDS